MIKLIFTLGILLSSIAVPAQLHLTAEMEDVIRAALTKDVDLTNQNIEKQKLELERKGIWDKYLPKVEATALYGYINSKGTLDLPTFNLPLTGYPLFNGTSDFSAKGQAFHAGVMARSVLFSGGQIASGARAVQYKNQGTTYMMALRKDEVIKDMVISLDQLAMLRAADKLIDESEKRLLKETERVEKAIAAGLAVPYDRDKIKLATLELKAKKTDLNRRQALLILKMQQATGMDSAAIAACKYEVLPIIIGEDLKPKSRNEVKALESFNMAAEYAVKKEKGSLLPTLGAFGGYSYSSLFNGEITAPLTLLNTTAHLTTKDLTLNPTWIVGLAMKWELFGGFERKHQIQTAELNQQQLDNKLRDTKEKIRLQLQKNKIEYASLSAQIDIARQREVVAQNNNILATKQYRAGLIGVTERLTAETDLYKESLNVLEAIIKQRQSALDTFQAAGVLESLISTNQ